MADKKVIPKTVSNLDELEEVPRGTHRLKAKDGKIWTKDNILVKHAREDKNDVDKTNRWIESMNFKVITEKEAYPTREEEFKKAQQAQTDREEQAKKDGVNLIA